MTATTSSTRVVLSTVGEATICCSAIKVLAITGQAAADFPYTSPNSPQWPAPGTRPGTCTWLPPVLLRHRGPGIPAERAHTRKEP